MIIFDVVVSANGKLVVWVGLDSWDSLMKGIVILRGTTIESQTTGTPTNLALVACCCCCCCCCCGCGCCCGGGRGCCCYLLVSIFCLLVVVGLLLLLF